MTTDLNSISDETYERWLRETGTVVDPENPSEQNLIDMLSNTLRETIADERAKGFVALANMALAMADKTLGCQVPVAKCLVLDLH